MSPDVASLVAPLQALQRLLARFDDQGIVIGGVAASLLGKPRLTVDIDVVLLLSNQERQAEPTEPVNGSPGTRQRSSTGAATWASA